MTITGGTMSAITRRTALGAISLAALLIASPVVRAGPERRTRHPAVAGRHRWPRCGRSSKPTSSPRTPASPSANSPSPRRATRAAGCARRCSAAKWSTSSSTPGRPSAPSWLDAGILRPIDDQWASYGWDSKLSQSWHDLGSIDGNGLWRDLYLRRPLRHLVQDRAHGERPALPSRPRPGKISSAASKR